MPSEQQIAGCRTVTQGSELVILDRDGASPSAMLARLVLHQVDLPVAPHSPTVAAKQPDAVIDARVGIRHVVHDLRPNSSSSPPATIFRTRGAG